MDNPVLDMTPDQVAVYRLTAQRRQLAQQERTVALRQEAWQVARRAAQMLRQRFHATRVVVFGSLIHEGCFTPWSDVDIAAWGIPAEETFRAIGAVMDLDRELSVNLVDINTSRPSLTEVIEKEGIEI
jgi:predicted nucleotidyltransferase